MSLSSFSRPPLIESKSKELDTILDSIEKNSNKRNIVIAKIEQKKEEMQEQEVELNKLLKQFLNNIASKDKKVEKYIRTTINRDQVKQLLGKPDSGYSGDLYYGSYEISFDMGDRVKAVFPAPPGWKSSYTK